MYKFMITPSLFSALPKFGFRALDARVNVGSAMPLLLLKKASEITYFYKIKKLQDLWFAEHLQQDDSLL